MTSSPHTKDPVAPIDPCLCPLCGQPNQCAMASASTHTDASSPSGTQDNPPCWCVAMQFDPALLASVPAQAANKACICKRCVEAHAQPNLQPTPHPSPLPNP